MACPIELDSIELGGTQQRPRPLLGARLGMKDSLTAEWAAWTGEQTGF